MKKFSILLIAVVISISILTDGYPADPGEIFLDLSWDFGTSKTVLPCSPLCVNLQASASKTGVDVDFYVVASFLNKNYYFPSWKPTPEIFTRKVIDETSSTLTVIDCIEMGKFYQNFDVNFYAAAVYSNTFDLASNILADTLHFVGQPVLSDKFSAVDSFVTDALNQEGAVGASIAVFSSCEILYSSGYGVKKYRENEPINAQTQFRIASMSKMSTAAAAMTLMEEGKLDLNAPVTDYVPYFQLYQAFDPTKITTHLCLTHTSGLQDYVDLSGDTDSEALSRFFQEYGIYLLLWSPPGRLWNYSNLGYDLAGLVVEETSNTPFTDIMEQRIFNPLGMMDSTYDSSEVLRRDNYAVGHDVDYYGNLEKYYNPDDYGSAVDNPAGMLFSTTEDMARFGMMLLCKGKEVLSQQSVATMSGTLVHMNDIPKDYYGYGLYQDLDDPLGGIGHDGSIPGFLTSMQYYPGSNLGVVVFVNSRNISPAGLSRGIVEILLDYEFPDPDYSTPPDTWGKYTGDYVDPYMWGRIRVYQDINQKLWAEFVDLERLGYENGPVQLYQYAGDTFFFDSALYKTTLTVTFWLDDNGQGEYFATRGGTAKRDLSSEKIRDEINNDLREQFWYNKMLPYSEYLISH